MDLATLQKISIQILSREVPTYKRYLYSKIDFNSKLIFFILFIYKNTTKRDLFFI